MMILASCGAETGPEADFALETGRAVTATVGAAGGELTTTDARGVRYTLTIPPQALAADVAITLTPVLRFPPLPDGSVPLAAVDFAPDGLQFALPAILRMTGVSGVAAGTSGLFGYAGDGDAVHAAIGGVGGGSASVLVTHFSGVGVIADVFELEPDASLPGATAAFQAIASAAYGADWTGGEWDAPYVQIIAALEAWYHDIVAPALVAADTDQELTNALAGWSAWQHVIECGADTCDPSAGNLHLWPAGVGFLIQQQLAELAAAAGGVAADAVVRALDRNVTTCRTNRDLAAGARAVYWDKLAILLGAEHPDDPLGECVTVELTELSFPDPISPGVPAELELVAGLSFGGAPSTYEHSLSVQLEASDAQPAVGGGNTALGTGTFTQAFTPDGDAPVVLGIRILWHENGLQDLLRLDTLVERPLGISVTLEPVAAILDPGAEAQFTATVEGTTNTAVTWSASGGALTPNGNSATYRAGSVPGSYAVTATSVADPDRSASAQIEILGGQGNGSVTLEGSPGMGTAAILGFANAGSAPECRESEPSDEVQVDPPLSLSLSVECSENAVSVQGAAMSGRYSAQLSYAFDVAGNALRSFSASGQTRSEAQGEGEGLGNAASAGRVIGNGSSNINFEFEVLEDDVEVVLTGQLSSSIATLDANVGAFASVRLRGPGGGELYFALAGRRFPADPIESNIAIGSTLRLPPGIYDLEIESAAAANTYTLEPRAEGDAEFTVTMSISP